MTRSRAGDASQHRRPRPWRACPSRAHTRAQSGPCRDDQIQIPATAGRRIRIHFIPERFGWQRFFPLCLRGVRHGSFSPFREPLPSATGPSVSFPRRGRLHKKDDRRAPAVPRRITGSRQNRRPLPIGEGPLPVPVLRSGFSLLALRAAASVTPPATVPSAIARHAAP